MTWKEHLAGAAGGTLGFIAGDVPGAITGYYAAKNFTKKYSKSMPSTSRTRIPSRSVSRGRTRSPRTRQGSAAKSVMRAPSRSASRMSGVSNNYSHRSGLTETTGVSTRLPNVTIKGSAKKFKKITKGKGKKTVHVSKKLKLKIKKVMAGDQSKVFGYYQQTTFDQFATPATVNQQGAYNIPSYNGHAVRAGLFFDPVLVAQAAGRLFNNKAAVINPEIYDVGMFDPNTVKIEVTKQWVVNRYHNDTNRTMTLKFYICKPKQIQPNQNLGPLSMWSNILTRQAASANDGSTLNSFVSPNIASITPNTLYCNPTMCAEFKKFFMITEELVILEPGQTWEHTLQGPEQVYDFQKFFAGSNAQVQVGVTAGDFQNLQKFCTCLFVVTIPDLVNDTAGGANIARTPLKTGNQIAMESTYHCKLRMPEPAGWKNDAVPTLTANQTQVLTNRTPTYVIDVFNLGTITTVHRVDEQNPAVTTA